MRRFLFGPLVLTSLISSALRGDIWISHGGSQLSLFSDEGEVLNELASDLASAQGIAVDGRGHLFVAEYGAGRIRMYDMGSGAFVRDILKNPAYRPMDLASDPMRPDQIIVIGRANAGGADDTDQLFRLSTSGQNDFRAFNNLSTGYMGIACDTESGQVYAALGGEADMIQAFKADTLQFVGNAYGIEGPRDIVRIGSDLFYSSADGGIYRQSSAEPWITGLKSPVGLATDGTNLWVADHAAGAVLCYSSDGVLKSKFEVSKPTFLLYRMP